MPTAVQKLERASRLRDYFDLQLRFAATLAERGGRPLADCVTLFTNLHRRFGLGMLPGPVERGAGAATAPLWHEYLAGLGQRPGHDARLAWTVAVFLRAPDERPPPGQHRFGCFAYDEPGPEGIVRIHFANLDDDGVSPLATAKAARRRAELGAMFAAVARAFPEAHTVKGGSWLYHLDAYRRLFPPAYTASRQEPEAPLHFHGSSSWGQFIDHLERVRPEPRAVFLRNLAALDPARPGRAFPLPALRVSAALDVFVGFYCDTA
ncbi:MAG: hypothetical protein RIC56_05110 [Pseudomonadales bacterium]